MNAKEQLKIYTEEVEAVIEKYLPAEEGHQKTVLEAMDYSVRAGGKRLRPLLMRETYRLFGGNGSEVEPFMAAIEMIHTSSLIHDDLPCMDNDTLRRGVPTTWVKYGYDMAVLAGDGLMIYAFETAAKALSMTENKERAARCMGLLAEKTGIYGMIGGQTVDVELTNKPIPKDKLDFIYRLKTGALLEASMMIGAILAGAGEDSLPGGDRRLWPNRGGHGGPLRPPAGVPVPDVSPGPDLHADSPRRGGCVLHRSAGSAVPGEGRVFAAAGGIRLHPAGGAVQHPRGFEASAHQNAAAGGPQLSEA